jgi:predicted nucleic acid-binding protein
MQFIDTNIFIRYLTQDDPQKAAACFRLFEQAKRNEVEVTTSEVIIAEVVYILSSKRLYNLSRHDIRVRLYPLIALSGLKLPYKRQLLRALDLYSMNNVDFEDALSVATMERQAITDVYSYDEDFDRIRGSVIQRIEP